MQSRRSLYDPLRCKCSIRNTAQCRCNPRCKPNKYRNAVQCGVCDVEYATNAVKCNKKYKQKHANACDTALCKSSTADYTVAPTLFPYSLDLSVTRDRDRVDDLFLERLSTGTSSSSDSSTVNRSALGSLHECL
jgi:hypothetical protein